MTDPAPAPAAKDRFSVWVGTTLLAGVLASATLLTAGLVWRWCATGSPRFDYALPKIHVLGFAKEEIEAVLRGEIRPRLLINTGLLLLLLTPYARVLLSFFYFTFTERNWKYSLFTGVVLSVLSYSLLF